MHVPPSNLVRCRQFAALGIVFDETFGREATPPPVESPNNNKKGWKRAKQAKEAKLLEAKPDTRVWRNFETVAAARPKGVDREDGPVARPSFENVIQQKAAGEEAGGGGGGAPEKGEGAERKVRHWAQSKRATAR